MKIAVVLAATAIMALTSQAHAYGSFDPSAWSVPKWQPHQRWRPYTGYEPYRHRYHAKAHQWPSVARQGHIRHIRHGAGNLTARSGAMASVSETARPHFQCLVDRLEAAGYRIAFMGGFAARSGPSAHPTGNALDINQTGRGRVTQRFPAGIEAICQACGVYSGAHFGDYGHFEMPAKYGYVNVRGHRYASRGRYRTVWIHHRRFARAW